MITCWLHQQVVSSRLDANTAFPAWTQRHVETCPICARFYASGIMLVRNLSSSNEDARLPASPFLHGKIMSAIRAQDRLIAEPQTSLGRLGWVVAVGTACLLLTFILLRHGPLAPAQRPAVATLVQPELAFSVNLPSTAQVDEWTTALDKPLENETQLVLNDAKTVIISLKNSFLPDNDKGL